MSVGPFGVAVGVGLGLGAKSGVGETDGDGVGAGDELCAKALRGGITHPATARRSKQHTAVTARTSSDLAQRKRTNQRDAASSRAVGHYDLRCF